MMFKNKNIIKNKAFELFLITALVLAMEMFFFRNILFNDRLMGDIGDGRFINYLLEHIYQSLLGKRELMDLNMFYPISGDFAYSDLLLGFVPVYALMRMAGLNTYFACKYAMILIHIFGAFSMLYLLRAKFKLPYVASFLGMIAFMYSNNANVMAHMQFFIIYYLPFYFIFLINFLENLQERKSIIKNGGACILLMVITFYTSGYYGYFLAIYTVILFALIFIMHLKNKKTSMKESLSYVRKFFKEYILLSVGGILLMIPFLMIYLPVTSQFPKREWADIEFTLPSAVDLVNISKDNWIFGQIFDVAYGVHELHFMTIGFPLLSFILIFMALWHAYKEAKCNIEFKSAKAFYIGMSACISILMMLKLIDGTSFWRIVYEFVPGVGTMRALYRWIHMLCVPIGILLGYYISSIKFKKKYRYILFTLLFCIQYIWIEGVYSVWAISNIEEIMDAVSPPPRDCKILYVVDRDPPLDSYTVPQLNGTEIADRYGLKTINGYNSFYPEGWNDINFMYKTNYESKVYEWIKKNQLEDVYAYHIDEDRWEKITKHPTIDILDEYIPNSNCVIIEDEVYMPEEGMVYSDYLKLYPGSYEVSIYGKHLNILGYNITYDKGQKTVEHKIEHDSNGEAVKIVFEIDGDQEDVQIILINGNEDFVEISDIIIECIEERN